MKKMDTDLKVGLIAIGIIVALLGVGGLVLYKHYEANQVWAEERQQLSERCHDKVLSRDPVNLDQWGGTSDHDYAFRTQRGIERIASPQMTGIGIWEATCDGDPWTGATGYQGTYDAKTGRWVDG